MARMAAPDHVADRSPIPEGSQPPASSPPGWHPFGERSSRTWNPGVSLRSTRAKGCEASGFLQKSSLGFVLRHRSGHLEFMAHGFDDDHQSCPGLPAIKRSDPWTGPASLCRNRESCARLCPRSCRLARAGLCGDRSPRCDRVRAGPGWWRGCRGRAACR